MFSEYFVDVEFVWMEFHYTALTGIKLITLQSVDLSAGIAGMYHLI